MVSTEGTRHKMDDYKRCWLCGDYPEIIFYDLLIHIARVVQGGVFEEADEDHKMFVFATGWSEHTLQAKSTWDMYRFKSRDNIRVFLDYCTLLCKRLKDQKHQECKYDVVNKASQALWTGFNETQPSLQQTCREYLVKNLPRKTLSKLELTKPVVTYILKVVDVDYKPTNRGRCKNQNL